MAPDEVDAGSGGAPRRRGLHWRAAVVTGIVVLGTAVAVPVVYGSSGAPARDHPAMMMMDSAQMTEMMQSRSHMMNPAQMAEMMQPGMMMSPGPMMGGAR